MEYVYILCLPLALKPNKDCDLDLLHVSKAVVSLAFPFGVQPVVS